MRTRGAVVVAFALLTAAGCAVPSADALVGSFAEVIEKADRGWAETSAVFDTTGLETDDGSISSYVIASTSFGFRAVTTRNGQTVTWASDDFGLFTPIGGSICCIVTPGILAELDGVLILAGTRWDGTIDIPVLFQSADGGITWSELTAPAIEARPVAAINIVAGSALLTLTDGDEITYVGSDDLVTWTELNPPSSELTMVTDGTVLFAVSDSWQQPAPRGPALVWSSVDAGATFTVRPTLDAPSGAGFVAVNGRLLQLPYAETSTAGTVLQGSSVLEPGAGWTKYPYDEPLWGTSGGGSLGTSGRPSDGTFHLRVLRQTAPADECPPTCTPNYEQVLLQTIDGVTWTEITNAKFPGFFFRIKQRGNLIVTESGTIVMWIGPWIDHPEMLDVTRLIGAPD